MIKAVPGDQEIGVGAQWSCMSYVNAFSVKNGCTVAYCHNCFNKKDAVQRGNSEVGETEAGRGGKEKKEQEK